MVTLMLLLGDLGVRLPPGLGHRRAGMGGNTQLQFLRLRNRPCRHYCGSRRLATRLHLLVALLLPSQLDDQSTLRAEPIGAAVEYIPQGTYFDRAVEAGEYIPQGTYTGRSETSLALSANSKELWQKARGGGGEGVVWYAGARRRRRRARCDRSQY